MMRRITQSLKKAERIKQEMVKYILKRFTSIEFLASIVREFQKSCAVVNYGTNI